jgi:nitronate monooxygenase
MKTTLCTRVGIEVPIIQAPMGGAVGPALASAVSNAGGLGMLALWRADAETMRKQIRETRALSCCTLSPRPIWHAGRLRAEWT